QPGLAALLGDDTARLVAADELHLTPIEMDTAEDVPAPTGTDPGSMDPLAVLEYMAWPDFAAGGALACDLSPGASQRREGGCAWDLPAGGTLGVVVGALAHGTSCSAVRRPAAEGYARGAALVPDLTPALTQTLQPQS